MSTSGRRVVRKKNSRPNWRVIRYCDDFVVLVDGCRSDVEALHEEIAHVLTPMGLRLSQPRLGLCIWARGSISWGSTSSGAAKQGRASGMSTPSSVTGLSRSLKDKIRALTNRTSQQDPRAVLIRLGQIMRGWANYFKHAVCKKHSRLHRELRMAQGDPLVDGTVSLEVEGRPPAPHRPHRTVAQTLGRRDRPVQTSPRSRSPDTATEATRSPAPGPVPNHA